jgi:hypothetical protein
VKFSIHLALVQDPWLRQQQQTQFESHLAPFAMRQSREETKPLMKGTEPLPQEKEAMTLKKSASKEEA